MRREIQELKDAVTAYEGQRALPAKQRQKCSEAIAILQTRKESLGTEIAALREAKAKAGSEFIKDLQQRYAAEGLRRWSVMSTGKTNRIKRRGFLPPDQNRLASADLLYRTRRHQDQALLYG